MRTPSPRHRTWAATVGVLLGLRGEAQADDSFVRVRVEYRGAEGCSDDAAYLRELAARDARVRPAGPGERAPLLVVTVTRAGSGVHGRLVIEDVDGAVSRRDVDGDGCQSVLSALALMGAIAVDPAAPLGVAAGSASATAGGSAAPSASAAPGDADGGAGNRASKPPEEAPTSTDTDSAEDGPYAGGYLRAAGAGAGRGVRLALAGGAGATTGTAPSVAWTVPIVAEVGWGRVTSMSPLLRFGFEHADSGQDAATGGDARFVLNEATLDACASFPVTRRMSLSPCLHTEGGAMSAAGSDVQPARQDTRPWLGVGVIGAVRYLVLYPVFVELSLGVRVPLVRDKFIFEPDTTVFMPPVVAGMGGGSIGISIL